MWLINFGERVCVQTRNRQSCEPVELGPGFTLKHMLRAVNRRRRRC